MDVTVTHAQSVTRRLRRSSWIALVSVAILVTSCRAPSELSCEVAWMRGGDLYLATPDSAPSVHWMHVEPDWARYVEWAPDGRSLLFARHDAGWNVWSFDAASHACVRLTEPGDNRVPSWSPDGTSIAWMRGGDGTWLMRADGGGARRVSTRGYRDVRPSWSPDGRRIAIEHVDEDGVGEIWVVPVGTGETGEACWRRHAGAPAWSPDGAWIACRGWHEGRRAILLLDARSPDAAPRVVTTDDTWLDGPSWSPDGSRVAFVRGLEGTSQLFVSTLTGEPRGVFTYAGRSGVPRWSPDGRWLFVVTANGATAVRAEDGSTVPIGEDGASVVAPRPR